MLGKVIKGKDDKDVFYTTSLKPSCGLRADCSLHSLMINSAVRLFQKRKVSVQEIMECLARLTFMTILCTLLSACNTSNKYIGQTFEVPEFARCTIHKESNCFQATEDFDFTYKVSRLSDNDYHIEGEVKWKGSVVYQSARTIGIDFFNFKDNRVMNVIRVWPSGSDLTKPMKINKKFTSPEFDYIIVGGYYGTVSELR